MTMREEFEAWAETHALSEEARGYGMVQGAWQDAWAAATERAAKVCDANRQDAERYRWLRDTNHDLSIRSNSEHLEPLQVPVIYIGHPVERWTLGAFASAPCGQSFDVAIDAAIIAAAAIRGGERAA